MKRRCRSRLQSIPSRVLSVNFRVSAKDAITAEIECELRKARDLVEGMTYRHKYDARSRDDLGMIWCALGIIAELGAYAAALLGDREW